MPGYSIVEIKTVLDRDSQTVSKTIKYHGGIGLNSLSMWWKFVEANEQDISYVKTILIRDLSMLPDGKYKIAKQKRPEKFLADAYFDYVWLPVGNDYDD